MPTPVSSIFHEPFFPSKSCFFLGDNTLDIKMSLHKIERNGEEYFKIKNLEVASIIGEGLIKLTPKEPELQFASKSRKKIRLILRSIFTKLD